MKLIRIEFPQNTEYPNTLYPKYFLINPSMSVVETTCKTFAVAANTTLRVFKIVNAFRF